MRYAPTENVDVMDDLERRKILNRLTKSALVDLVLIQIQPGFNRGLTLDKLLIDSLLRLKQEAIDKTMKAIESLNRSSSGYRKIWFELNEQLDKLWVEHGNLMDLAYPKKKEETHA